MFENEAGFKIHSNNFCAWDFINNKIKFFLKTILIYLSSMKNQ